MAFVVGVSLVVAKNVKIARKVLLSGEGIIRIILGTIGQKENMAYQVTNITSLPMAIVVNAKSAVQSTLGCVSTTIIKTARSAGSFALAVM